MKTANQMPAATSCPLTDRMATGTALNYRQRLQLLKDDPNQYNTWVKPALLC